MSHENEEWLSVKWGGSKDWWLFKSIGGNHKETEDASQTEQGFEPISCLSSTFSADLFWEM